MAWLHMKNYLVLQGRIFKAAARANAVQQEHTTLGATK